MRCALCGLLLLFAGAAFGQQTPSDPPSHLTPPTFPEGQVPRQGMPPDTEAPPPQQMSSAQIAQQIQDKSNSEPELANANVKANANDSAVILTGTVDSEREHQLALGIARSYAGDREILDRIEVKGRT